MTHNAWKTYLTCCSTLAKRTTRKILNTDDRLLILFDVVKISTRARATMVRSSLFLHKAPCCLSVCLVNLQQCLLDLVSGFSVGNVHDMGLMIRHLPWIGAGGQQAQGHFSANQAIQALESQQP